MLARSQPNWAGDYVLDTKRGIVVNTRNMTELQDQLYKRSFFISARPDLTDVERYQWVIRLDMGEKLLMAMRHGLQREAMRVHLMYPLASRYERLKPFYEQYIQLQQPYTSGFQGFANRDWEDQSRLVNYVEKILFKTKKYGISSSKRWMKPQDAQDLEDQLTARFSKEMRKPPKQKKSTQQEED